MFEIALPLRERTHGRFAEQLYRKETVRFAVQPHPHAGEFDDADADLDEAASRWVLKPESGKSPVFPATRG